MAEKSFKEVAKNKKAYHDYFIIEKMEAGIELFGTEVKSIRQGGINLKEAWCSIVDGEIFINGMHISPYREGNIFNHSETRSRKLLLHKKEIKKIENSISLNGLTLVPLKGYFKDNKFKILVGIGRGKKNYDKRETLKERDIKREVDKNLKRHY